MGKRVTKKELTLLKPIGDGSSCVNPARPPWLAPGADGIETCPGERCHSDGGCSNRRLILNSKEISDALLAQRVYEANWQAMLSRNQYAFLKFHVPAILFNSALIRLLETGPYAHVVSKLRARLASVAALKGK